MIKKRTYCVFGSVSTGFMSSYFKKFKFYIIDCVTDNFKYLIFSNNKFRLSRYRYRYYRKHYFISSVRSTKY